MQSTILSLQPTYDSTAVHSALELPKETDLSAMRRQSQSPPVCPVRLSVDVLCSFSGTGNWQPLRLIVRANLSGELQATA
jgi:hypothetical protein